MTVLDLDPPRSPLRLVSSTGPAAIRDHRYRDAASLHGEMRALYSEVLQASLIWQAPVDPDALRIILAVKQNTTAGPARSFSAAIIWQLMFVDVVSWCRNRKLKVPAGSATALIRVIEYLDTTDSFDEISDSADLLYEAVDECTGGWADEIHPSEPVASRKPTTKRKGSIAARGQRSLRSTRGSQRT